ncbi:ubiquitin-related modifier [Histomonas meleagridis]|uniref:ubiquitin-related modifier n=1 Tax=Histomonas meleagridis TaxID=135588 RepID=UPI0035594DDB|nr:ubiquitin-related modifier [Histomonas meleagridis]KAH0802486.1 ubiquitin-related modifier [Histomonas meleagridis]
MVLVHIDFEGGLQTDFNAPNGIDLEVEEGTRIEQLPKILVDKYIEDPSKIRFTDSNGNVLPGVLIMVNDIDAAIEGVDSVLSEKDTITFISTLHGG